jgi:hypothetical protein
VFGVVCVKRSTQLETLESRRVLDPRRLLGQPSHATMRTRETRRWFLGAALLVGACFPEDKLVVPRDAARDTGLDRVDVVTDHVTIDENIATAKDVAPDTFDDAAMDADIAVKDAASDAGGACVALPTERVTSMPVGERITNANDIAFDDAGRLAVAAGRAVRVTDNMGNTSTVFSGLPGDVHTLRFTSRGDLIALVLLTNTDGGTDGGTDAGRPDAGLDASADVASDARSDGPADVSTSAQLAAIYRGTLGTTTPMQRLGMIRQPGGLTVGPNDVIWFTETSAGTVSRFSSGDSTPTVVVTDVPSPTLVAFDLVGSALLIASPVDGGTLYRAEIFDTGAGTTSAPAQIEARALGDITGLAVDSCSNIYVTDARGQRVLRLTRPVTTPVVLFDDVMQPRGLAFAQGDMRDPRALHTLSSDQVRAANVTAPGAPLPLFSH